MMHEWLKNLCYSVSAQEAQHKQLVSSSFWVVRPWLYRQQHRVIKSSLLIHLMNPLLWHSWDKEFEATFAIKQYNVMPRCCIGTVKVQFLGTSSSDVSSECNAHLQTLHRETTSFNAHNMKMLHCLHSWRFAQSVRKACKGLLDLSSWDQENRLGS